MSLPSPSPTNTSSGSSSSSNNNNNNSSSNSSSSSSSSGSGPALAMAAVNALTSAVSNSQSQSSQSNNSNSLLSIASSIGMTQEEIKSCRIFFNNFDRYKNGFIYQWELQVALEAMGYNPNNYDMQNIINNLQIDKNGPIDFTHFLRAIQMQREFEKRLDHEGDFLAAFVAMGGKSDLSGSVSSDRLRRVIKEDFALTFKIDEILEEMENEQDGYLNYNEFKILFS